MATQTRDMKALALSLMAASTAIPFSNHVAAQSESPDFRLEEVIVTARRREESLQTVPISVNAVSGDMIEQLNIQDFEDMQAIIPGLTLEKTAIVGSASLRGVRFDAFSSLTGTVEFYMNDAYTTSIAVLQSMYDINQVEVLRGPQGTLRGRASPSGSITLTTRTPDLDRFGGEINANGDDAGGRRLWGALNLPLWEDKLAIRVAGLVDSNQSTQVESINSDIDPRGRTESQRVSATFAPTDNLNLDFTYQKLDTENRRYAQVESANRANPALAASYAPISPGDRLGVTDIPQQDGEQNFDIYNLRAEWALGPAILYYVGQYVEYSSRRKQDDDIGDFFGPGSREEFQSFGQNLDPLESETQSHELRLQSDEPLFDRFDWVIGAFYTDQESTNKLDTETPVSVGLGPEAGPDDAFGLVVQTPVQTDGGVEETSFFGHLTWHLGEATELSLGTRYIEFDNRSMLSLNGNILDIATTDQQEDTWIYSASLKHEFTPDLMAYGSIGTSWRPGPRVIGDFSESRSELENSFLNLPSEDSTSYELGLKSTWLDGTLRFNAAVFYQEFEEYPYRSPGGVNYISTDSDGVESVGSFNFVGAVPVNVHGLELEGFWQNSPNWYVSGTIAYAKSEIDNGFIPCNDYFPADGVPDSSGEIPTVGEIRERTGGDTITGCTVDGLAANFAPEWSGTVQSEYSFPIQDYDLFVRGQASLYGDSENDETNPLDDVDAYGILNLYTGIRDAGGKWEIMLYGNNVTDTERVLSRGASPASVSYQRVDLSMGQAAVGTTGISGFREITMTAPREFGVNLRYSF